MYLKPKKMALTAAALLLGAGAAVAVPAKPGLIERHQEDGSTILVKLRGDERAHFILSEDDYPLIDVNGVLHYAYIDASGKAVASEFRAVAPAKRNAATRAFLDKIDRTAAFEAVASAATLQADASTRRMPARQIPALAGSDKGMLKGPGLMASSFPNKGDQKAIVILVSYSDFDFTLDDPYNYFNGMLNKQGFAQYGGTGSARDFFIESSDSLFRPHFDLYGPVKLPNKRSYYGANDAYGDDLRPEMMVVHACQSLDEQVDFKQYDHDGDGKVDNIFIFYAGEGEASGGSSSTVWPHAWNVYSGAKKEYRFDGVLIDSYGCTNEWVQGRPDGAGTFVHEFSHMLGLPDLYATSYTTAFTPGEFSALDYGPYNNDGCTPPLYSAFERYALDWMTPTVLAGPDNITIPPVGSNFAYIIPTAKENEFFLLENRQNISWDKYIPGHGMLVWHVDYNPQIWRQNVVNNTASHQYVDIEEADNKLSDYNRNGDPFPGVNNITEFTDNTRPSMKSWNGQAMNLPITEITEDGQMISFKVSGGKESSEATTLIEPTDEMISSRGFTASWKPVDGAEKYELYVYFDATTGPKVMNGAQSAFRIEVGNATSYEVKGLQPLTWYAYSVVAHQKGRGASAVSPQMRVLTKEDDSNGTENGIGNIEADFDFNAPIEYYNLQGLRINNPAKGQIVIMRQGTRARKIRF